MQYQFDSSWQIMSPERGAIAPVPGAHGEALRADWFRPGTSWGEITSRFLAGTGNHHRWLPGLELSSDGRSGQVPAAQAAFAAAGTVHDIAFHGSNGNIDRVAGIRPQAGETVAQLIKRLHPALSDEQLAHEVRQVEKYNRDYGNDLGDGNHLDPNKDVYLTSVKYRDARGNISRIEGPTGRITEFAYGPDGRMSAYKMSAADGSVTEECRLDNSGRYLLWMNGQMQAVQNVKIDSHGDMIITDYPGNKITHLTSGTDITTTYGNYMPICARAERAGQQIARYDYEYGAQGVKIFAQYADDPGKRVLLSDKTNPEALRRLAVAQGLDVQQQQSPAGYERVTLSPAGYPFSFSEFRSELGHKVAGYAHYLAGLINTHHYCFSGVAKIMDHFGVHLHGDAAWEAKDQLAHDPRFVQVSMAELRPGDILVSGKNSAHPWGHIRVYLGQNMEASDHVQQLITGEGYGGTSVFRMRST